MSIQLILLINPLSMHQTLCEKLNDAGIKIMALYTFSLPKGYFNLDDKYFVSTEQLTKNLNQDLQRIKELIQGYDLISAMPAFEIDFVYAEELAYALCPQAANNPHDSYLRCKKYEMNEALRQAGLNAIPQVRIPHAGVIPDYLPLRFPVIVKPSYQSAGSVGVKICHNLDEVRVQVGLLQQGEDAYGRKFMADIAVQEKVEGVEHFADSVSWKGKHYITSICKYHKINIGGRLIYRYIEFINPHEPIWELCYEYSLKTLDALKVNYGFAHTEFMVTSDNQPFLMEINPRLSGLGGEVNRLCKLLTDYDQSEVYISLLKQVKTTSWLNERYQQQNKQGHILFMFSWKETVFKGFRSDILQKLASAQVHFRLFKPEGSQLTAPKDLLDVVMTITLVDENIVKIISDTKYLQDLEKEGKLFNE